MGKVNFVCKSINKLCASLDEHLQFYLCLPFSKNDGNQIIFNCLIGKTDLYLHRHRKNSKLILYLSSYKIDEYLKMYEKLTGKTITIIL